MRILLDTKVWLWLCAEPDLLGRPVRKIVEDEKTELFLSAASAWEIAAKAADGQLELPEPVDTFIMDRMQRTNCATLPITTTHILAAAELDQSELDAFDRLLAAQAAIEGMPLMTVDPAFDAFDIEIIVAD